MQSVSEIKEILKLSKTDQGLRNFIECYREDERSGVQALVASAQKKIDAYNKELQRIHEMKKYEVMNASCGYLCGIDEVGRGPLAGPVYAAAVILPTDCDILYLNDSKKLSEKKREELYDVIMEKAVAVGIGHASPQRIDEINILQATFESMTQAVHQLGVKPGALLIDAVHIPQLEEYKQVSI
ncbi:MAG: ribonuclease HII, partial [Lachnospiraceae bacterium]|nr:ribonuclease HII [Lachnospiraceae bacterium]